MKQFMRRMIGQDTAEVLDFGPEHFKEAGIAFAPLGGLPRFEAHQLVNRWNRLGGGRFVYWLEA